jgi:hypothetical protein
MRLEPQVTRYVVSFSFCLSTNDLLTVLKTIYFKFGLSTAPDPTLAPTRMAPEGEEQGGGRRRQGQGLEAHPRLEPQVRFFFRFLYIVLIMIIYSTDRL